MTKLYAVTVTRRVDMVVFTENESEAEEEALVCADDEVDNNGNFDDWEVYGFPRLVSSLKHVENHWRDGIPYGEGVDDRTVAEILAATAEVVK